LPHETHCRHEPGAVEAAERRRAQLIVRGKMAGTLDASAYGRDKRALLEVAMESYGRLAQDAQLMIVEGAGSPAETNLRKNDIANMDWPRRLACPSCWSAISIVGMSLLRSWERTSYWTLRSRHDPRFHSQQVPR